MYGQKMPSVMSHNFSQVPRADIPRASFNRSSGLKTTFNAGNLVPIFIDEVLPGDTFNLNMMGFGRLATPLHPIMDNLYLDTFFFFVPNRLVWENWQRFNGEQDNPGDSTDYLVPTLSASASSGFDVGTLFDYFGLPTGVDISSGVVNALPFRAYNLIYNEWFRDENLIDSAVVSKGDGPDNPNDYTLRRRGKRHDYFTSCLPWPQKGEAVSLPLAGNAPITNSGEPAGSPVRILGLGGSGSRRLDSSGSFLTYEAGNPAFDHNLFADLSDVAAATINDLREAFQVQRLLERDARGGTRYIEILRSHFGVTSPDARLQRPEYLGGGSTRLQVTPVAQTSSTDATSPQGNLAAAGTVGVDRHGFTKSFVEHGYVIGIACVRADLTYQQGLNRMWSRQGRFDFYWPALAHLGEQAVLNKEIFYDESDSENEGVFGYQERWAEYRYKPSQITGLFRSAAPQSLDTWHLSQFFEDRPVLGQTFIEEHPPIDRVVAVPSEPDLIFDSYFSLKCARPMPLYSVPGLIDHF